MAQKLLGVWASQEPLSPKNELPGGRAARYYAERSFAIFLRYWLVGQIYYSDVKPELGQCLAVQLGLDLEGILANKGTKNSVPLEVHAVRPTVRLRPNGHSKIELLVMLTQSKRVDLLDEMGKKILDPEGNPLRFKVRGGCTLLIDPEVGRITYAISKRLPSRAEVDANSSPRLARQMEFFTIPTSLRSSAGNRQVLVSPLRLIVM